MLCTLLRVIARHLRKHMVAHVSGAEMVVEPIEEGVWAIDGAQSSAQPSPNVIAVVRDVRIRMRHPGVEDHPKVYKHVRGQVAHKDSSKSIYLCSPHTSCYYEGNAERGQCNAVLPTWREMFRIWSEVISIHRKGSSHDAAILQPSTSSDVEEQIRRQSKHRFEEDLKKCEGIFTNQIKQLVKSRHLHLFKQIRNVHLTLHQVICLAMVPITMSVLR